MLTRRRFIAISAALAPSTVLGNSPDLHVETGLALGAKVTLRLCHPDAPRLAQMAMTEIHRLEQVFSLYQPESALVRLNRAGLLSDPPFELLECLGIAGAVHLASGGLFDPTIQPLWQAEAVARQAGHALSEAGRAAARVLVDWPSVVVDPDRITLRPGMALTLNGVAQGYIADRVAALLASYGLSRALIDTGELLALEEGTWPVQLLSGNALMLCNRALATSAPLGMTFGGDGMSSHILDPQSGRPVKSNWRLVTISADSAALADALSTAACLTPSAEALSDLCHPFADAKIEMAIPA